MRKFFALFAMAAAAMACQKIGNIAENPVGKMSFYASADTGTKVTLDEENNILWQPEDAINVFAVCANPTQDCRFTTTIVNPSKTADFSGSSDPGASGYYAVYPYQEPDAEEGLGFFDTDEDGTPETVKLYWNGCNQKADPFTFDKEKAFMMAYTEDNSLSFKHVFAYLKFTTTFDCESIEFQSNGGETIGATKISLQMDKDGLPVITETSAKGPYEKDLVTLYHGQSEEYVPAGTYIVALCPGTLAGGFEITFKGAPGDNNWSKKTVKSVDLQRGHILNIGSFSSSDFITTGAFAGTGSESDPYQITSLEQLKLLAEIINGSKHFDDKYWQKHYKLINNIDCEGALLQPIGNRDFYEFNGVFDGNYKTISNYRLSSGDNGSALFLHCDYATIKNLTSMPIALGNGYKDKNFFVYSGLVGFTFDGQHDDEISIIENCHVKPADQQYIDQYGPLQVRCGDADCAFGGVVGEVRGDTVIRDCTNELNLILDTDQTKYRQGDIYAAGGIVGRANPCYGIVYLTVDRCRNSGSVSVTSTAEYTCGGGIIGSEVEDQPETAYITNCVNRGNIGLYKVGSVKTHGIGGGIVGNHDSDGYLSHDPFIYNCLNSGDITTSCWYPCCGGIMGYCYDDDTAIWSCVSLGSISAPASGQSSEPFIGAMCGSKYGYYHNCFWTTGLQIVHGKTTAEYEQKVNCSQRTVINEAFGSEMTGYTGQIPDNHPYKITYCEWGMLSGELNIYF